MKNYFDLTGDVALVTGASSGLGVQFAKALANQGAKLALLARREERLQAVQKEISEQYGVEVKYYVCDVTDFDKVAETVKAVADDFGKIDILVNNAGLGMADPLVDFTPENWKKIIDININSLFYMAREVGKYMIENGYGRVINMGSVHSSVVMKDLPVNAYAVTKGAVKMFTVALAAEWAKKGITVNAIGPAYFESEMTQDVVGTDAFQAIVNTYCPMGRIGKTGELDTTLLYFASHASSYTTGQLITVDGGWTTI